VAGLTSTGYLARTASEWFDIAKTEYNRICADLGFSVPRYDRAEFSTAVLLITAQIASEIDNGVSAVFDAHDPNQASGFLLRYLAQLAHIPIDEGSKSRVTLKLTGWANGPVLLSAGAAKASDGTNEWVLLEDVTLPSAAPYQATAVFEASAVGPISAAAGTIVNRVTGVAGWTGVTNDAAAIVGTSAETDASIRNKISKGLGSSSSRSSLAIQTVLQSLNGVQKVRVVYNPTFAPVTVSTRSIPENGVGIWVYPNTITTVVQQQILSQLFGMLGGNVNRSLPTATGADGVVGEVTGADLRPHREGFWFMSATLITVDVFIDPSTGYEPGGTLSSVTAPIQEVVRLYFESLEPGETIRQQDLLGLVAAVEGVARTTISFSVAGAALTTNDVAIDAASFATLDTSAASGGIVVRQS